MPKALMHLAKTSRKTEKANGVVPVGYRAEDDLPPFEEFSRALGTEGVRCAGPGSKLTGLLSDVPSGQRREGRGLGKLLQLRA